MLINICSPRVFFVFNVDMNIDGSCITDSRNLDQLGSNTISGFLRSKVRAALKRAMKDGDMEPACYWSAELLCSFRPEEVWEEIIGFYGTSINTASLNIAVYIAERIGNFKDIANNEEVGDLRNNYDVRRIFAEVIAVTILSRRRQSLRVPSKLDRKAFEMSELSPLLRADKSDYVTEFIKAKDPSDIHIPLNELSYHLTIPSGDADLACYWIDWLLAYVGIMRKDKHPVHIQEREWPAVQGRYCQHPIWAAWDCILGAAERKSEKQSRAVKSLVVLFSLRFKDTTPARRRHILYTAVYSLIEEPRQYPSLCRDMKRVSKVKDRIDLIYCQVNANRESAQPKVTNL